MGLLRGGSWLWQSLWNTSDAVSSRWLADHSRAECGQGWRGGVRIWLTSERGEQQKAARRERFQRWRAEKDRKSA